jgi:ribokinase
VIGAVGDDPAGRMILSELAASGIRADVAVRPGPTGTFVLADGQIRVERGVSRELTVPETIDADAVLVSGYLAPENIEAALAGARAAWVALDAARLTELPPGGNTLVASEETARSLTGREAEHAVRTLSERYRLACVTRGARGAVAALAGRVESAAADPVGGNALGAGDAFAAALLVGLAGGAGLAEALADACRWGSRAAALSSPA